MTEESPRNSYEQSLREEYTQRNEFLRYWGTEQRLVALAFLSLNSAALVNLEKFEKPLSHLGLSFIMALLGFFGAMHNYLLCDRYDKCVKRLIKIAQELHITAVFYEHITAVFHEQEKPRRYGLTMRFWFYFLYIGAIAFWIWNAWVFCASHSRVLVCGILACRVPFQS